MTDRALSDLGIGPETPLERPIREPVPAALERAGFWGLRIEQWSDEPFAVVEGIEFRSLLSRAGGR